MSTTGHRAGVFKKPAKNHKSWKGKRTKGEITSENRGREGVKQIARSAHSTHRAISKDARRNQLKVIRDRKMAEAVERRRTSNAPCLVAVVSLGVGARPSEFIKKLATCDETIIQSTSPSTIDFSIPRFKCRISFLTPDKENVDSVLGAIRASDVLCLLWPMSAELSEWDEQLLTIIKANGLPTIVSVVPGLGGISNHKKKEDVRKGIEFIISKWSMNSVGIMPADSVTDNLQLLRTLNETRKKPLTLPMDLNNLAHSPNFDEFLNNPEFPPHFDQLELDSLLYGNDESQESTSSASFGFSDSHAGFRSRGDGSLGDSSSDSSPPLSCANFTENDQEMWDFGFQNPCPFENLEQQLGPVYHEEEVITQPNNDFLEAQFLDNAPLPVKQMPTGPKRIIAILPKQQQQSIRRVVNRPIHKVYRVREVPVNQQQQTYRISQSINLSPPHGSQDHVNQMYYSEQVPEFHMQSRSRPITRQASEDKRFVPIAPTVDIKTEPQIFSSEQNRKIRNRMYAQASRIRKKEAEENLKQNLQELLHENEILKAENASLKQRLSYYEHVDHDIRISQPMERSQKQKKIIAAGTVLMMFGIVAIISPFNINSSMNMNTHVIAISNETSLTAHRSRVLVSENTVPVVKKPQHDSYDYLNSTQNDCDLYKMNATETIRVNNDIERWVQVHSFDNVPLKFSGGLLNKEVMRKFNEERKMRASSVYGPKTLSALKKSEQAALRMRERTWRQLDLLKAGNNIQVDNDNAQRKRQNIEKIASIVRQNGDTLYIMTLQDYVFLPSLQKGPKSIPKLSLLLPSVPMNGTLLDQYTLLRVDCEVTGTGQLTLSNKQLSYLLP